jgi:hypothetical protein
MSFKIRQCVKARGSGHKALAANSYGLFGHSINYHIRRRVDFQRQHLGRPQFDLDRLTGVVFQNNQKYGCGASHVCASLRDIKSILGARGSFFLPGSHACHENQAERIGSLDAFMALPMTVRADFLNEIGKSPHW